MHDVLNRPVERLAQTSIPPFIPGHFPRLARIKMILPSGAMDHFARSGNDETFGSSFMGFHILATKPAANEQ